MVPLTPATSQAVALTQLTALSVFVVPLVWATQVPAPTVAVGVLVGVLVRVLVGGTAVLVGVLVRVLVGSTAVLVGVFVRVGVGVLVCGMLMVKLVDWLLSTLPALSVLWKVTV